MDSYVETQYNHHRYRGDNQQEEQQNSGLLRYRSAPSSLLFEYTQNLSESNKFSGGFSDENGSETYERKPQRLSNNTLESGFSNSSQVNSQLPPQYPKQSVVGTSTSMEKSLEIGHGGLNLNHQTSSPAGFFSQLHTQNGGTMMRGLGSFRGGNGTNGESSPRTGRLGVNHLPRIPEIGNENVNSWNDSGSDASIFSENGGLLNRPTMLTHHLSLPKTSTEMATIEKLLHFEDTVPCKVRAKRGCATHPRSIAERERRNRISERMRKLQELVPNMDKQTNIADMLDLAVNYVKGLQDEFQALTDGRAKCTCVNLQ